MLIFIPAILPLSSAAEDFVGSSSPYTVAFGIGITSASITVETVDNDVVDCSKSFKAVLSIPSSRSGLCVVAGEPDVAEIAIADNEKGMYGIFLCLCTVCIYPLYAHLQLLQCSDIVLDIPLAYFLLQLS